MSFQSAVTKDVGYANTKFVKRPGHQQRAMAFQGFPFSAHERNSMLLRSRMTRRCLFGTDQCALAAHPGRARFRNMMDHLIARQARAQGKRT